VPFPSTRSVADTTDRNRHYARVSVKRFSASATLRDLREADLPHLPSIESEAGASFRAVGMDAVANDDLPTVEELRVYLRVGRGWVAVDDHHLPIGYLIADIVDNEAHIEQVSVLPTWSRRGIGKALIDCAVVWAADLALTAITLTTFTKVAWNGPYYERLGFRYLPEDQIGPELREIRRQEARRGLDAWPRACMWKPVR
jgi:GNAT superfamily N-acetyltransferase